MRAEGRGRARGADIDQFTNLPGVITMQRVPRVFHVASALCPMRVRSRSVLKRVNAKQTRVAQAEKNDAR